MCHKSMDVIGWVESEDSDKDLEISKAVESVMQKSMHSEEGMTPKEKKEKISG